MNILLLSMPGYIPLIFRKNMKIPHLGMASVASNLSEGHSVYVGDLCTQRDNVGGAVKDAMDTYKPHIVGLSSMTFQYHTAKKLDIWRKTERKVYEQDMEKFRKINEYL